MALEVVAGMLIFGTIKNNKDKMGKCNG